MAPFVLGVPFSPQGVADFFIRLFGIPGALNRRLKDIVVECLAHAPHDLLLEFVIRAEMIPPWYFPFICGSFFALVERKKRTTKEDNVPLCRRLDR